MKVFEVEKLTFSIGRKKILDDVSFHVKKGEWLLIAGPNGAGKSTLIKIASGLWKKESGNIKIWGKELEEYSSKELARVMGTLHSSFKPLYNINVFDFVRLGVYAKTGFLSFYSGRNKKDVELAIETTEIEPFLHKGILNLSQGELQRVRIAKVLAQNPRIMVFDEPLLHLDIKHKVWVLELLARLRASGKTVITVVHDFSMAFSYPDRFLLLKNGKITYTGDREKQDELVKAFENTFEIGLTLKDDFLLPDKD